MDIYDHAPDFTALSTEELVTLRNDAATSYYGGAHGDGETLMTDDAFDALTAELEDRGLAEKVGHGATGGKTKHKRPMLSLRKVHDVADLHALVDAHPQVSYTVEPKLDGLAVSLRYNAQGRLHLAVTRGDGEQGDDITPALKSILERQGPNHGLDLGAGEVRGEIVMQRSAFARLNELRVESGEKPLANPRNAAAGMIARVARGLDALRTEPKDTIGWAKRKTALDEAAAQAGTWLTFIAYDSDMYGFTDRNVASLKNLTKLSGSSGVAPFVRLLLPRASFGNQDEGIDAAVAWLESHADDLDVDTDGVVVKFSDPKLREELGESSTAPRWALAYKYPNRPKQTVLRAVEWAKTRTGRVVPTAVFDPVELAGATVSRATLNNLTFLEELDVWIGDTIEVTRANEVIPNVVRRIGDHAADATPVLDPNGWPVGAGWITAQSFDQQRRLVSEIRMQAEDSGATVRVETFRSGSYITSLATGDRANDVGHSQQLFEVWPEPFAAVIESWLGARFDSLDTRFVYRREGRDLVHDGGRDPVKDISFAAKTLDILGLGEDVVRRLIASNPQIIDFPTLIEECRLGSTINPFERGTQKLVDKLVDEVLEKTSGPQDPAKWIKAAGVPGVGYRAGMKLCRHMTRYPAMRDNPSPFAVLRVQADSELLAIDGIGPAAVQALGDARADLHRWESIDVDYDWSKYALAEPGVDPSDDATVLPLTGKRVLVTGTLPTLSRKQTAERIEDLGGEVASSVSRNLDLLVAGEKAGSKLAKAKALGVEVMSGAEFEELTS